MNAKSAQQEFAEMIEAGNLSRLEELMRDGADVNFRGHDPDGETPLMRAVEANQPEVVAFLVALGADVNAAGRVGGATPLMISVGKPLIMAELIAAGANPNAQMAVHEMAAATGAPKVRLGGETALHMATAANDIEAIRALVAAGAEPEARNAAGMAPLDCALRSGAPSAAAIALAEAGAALTPERLEALHAGALPEEDFSAFRFTKNKSRPAVAELILNARLKSQSYPEEFRARRRPWLKATLWVHLFGILMICGYGQRMDLGFLASTLDAFTPREVLVVAALVALGIWSLWRESTPNCPSCGKNIRNCASKFCLVCGAGLHSGRCISCSEDRAGWLAALPWNRTAREWISHCPNCGVWLDSRLKRRSLWR